MSMFGSPWKDIDDTKVGTPYLVDNSGWGWFLIFIIIAVPFLMLGSAVFTFSIWICQHPVLSFVLYLIISIVIGALFYGRSSVRYRICGILATIFTMIPMGMGVALYAIPYVMITGKLSAAFDWILVTAFLCGITFFIFALCKLLKNGRIHLVMSLVFLALAYLFINNLIASESDVLSWQAIGNLYGLF